LSDAHHKLILNLKLNKQFELALEVSKYFVYEFQIHLCVKMILVDDDKFNRTISEIIDNTHILDPIFVNCIPEATHAHMD